MNKELSRRNFMGLAALALAGCSYSKPAPVMPVQTETSSAPKLENKVAAPKPKSDLPEGQSTSVYDLKKVRIGEQDYFVMDISNQLGPNSYGFVATDDVFREYRSKVKDGKVALEEFIIPKNIYFAERLNYTKIRLANVPTKSQIPEDKREENMLEICVKKGTNERYVLPAVVDIPYLGLQIIAHFNQKDAQEKGTLPFYAVPLEGGNTQCDSESVIVGNSELPIYEFRKKSFDVINQEAQKYQNKTAVPKQEPAPALVPQAKELIP